MGGEVLEDDAPDPDPLDPEADPWTDPSDLVSEDCLEFSRVSPLGGMQEVDDLATSWGQEWGVGSTQPEVVWPDMSDDTPLPQVTCDIARRACLTFPCGTGLGWDKAHPRSIVRLADEAIIALIRLFILAELLGQWPLMVGYVLICLIPKSDGGRRPIGLLPSFIRLWMRIRLDVARTWQCENERDYFYAGAMKGASVASWKQAARAEYAACSECIDYVANLLDLVKAFERVPHDWLVIHAAEYKYPMRMLRLSIRAYLLGRVIIVDAVCSFTVFASRGITAGSVLATVELRVLLIKCMDRVIHRFPEIELTVYVDDTSLEAVGPAKYITDLIVGATQCLADSFAQLRIELSPTKNLCCASAASISDNVARRLPSIKFRIVAHAKSLGATIMASKRRNTDVLKKRLSAVKARVVLYHRVRRTIGAKRTHSLLRTGGLPALVYGQANTGVSCTMLHRQRQIVAAAGMPAGAGGDLDMSLAIIDGSASGKADPAFAAHCDPISAWAEAVWCSRLPLLVLARLVACAVQCLRKAKNVWARVRGPGAAFVASAQRLGWKVASATHVIDDKLNDIHFDRDSPAQVRFLVEQSVRRWRWRRIELKYPSLKQGVGGFGVHMCPLYRLINSKKAPTEEWGHNHVGALCSAICNRQWTQSRLVRAGLAQYSTRACRLCVAKGLCTYDSQDPKFAGTLVHRLWTCPVIEPHRCSVVPSYLLRRVRAMIRSDFTLPPPACAPFHSRTAQVLRAVPHATAKGGHLQLARPPRAWWSDAWPCLCGWLAIVR